MSVNRVDQQQTVVPPRTESTAPAAASTQPAPAAAPAAPAAAQSSFESRAPDAAALGNGPARPSEHVAGSIVPGTQTPMAPGPINMRSREAKDAVEKSMQFIDQQIGASLKAQGGDATTMFDARQVEKDNLGMTHVRLDRVQDGLKVWGEQVITHLDRDGNVVGLTGEASKIPSGLGNQPTKISADQALAKAKDAFGLSPENRPTAEKIIYRADDGTYKVGYRVELRKVNGPERPQNMNYIVDAQTGQVDRKWNTISGIEIPKQAQRTADPITVKGSAEPNAKINDNSTVTSKITITDDVSIDKLGLGLNIAHTYRGDLVVKLTSPSGKTAVVSNRQGGSADDIVGNFDLSAFKGESSKGEWTLTVEDKAARDTGTLKQWGLEITGTPKTPPPPAPDTGTTIEKSTAPKAKIEDNKTVTSTIDVPEGGDIDSLQLNLDIAHSYRGDLVVQLTSPSGKTATISNREGGSADDIKGTFDLSQFAGEKVTGQWKLTVSDKAAQDTGTLNSWGLKIKTKGNEPPPPPPPPPPPGTADDQTLYVGKVDVGSSKNSAGQWVLKDTTRGQGIETRDAQNKSSPSGSKEITDNNNAFGEATDPKNQKGAVDAQYGAEMTYDFYKDVLGRNSIDGQGEALKNNVHINTNYVNAYWDGTQMSYGDGDGVDAGPLTTLDIAGHEISHGLTERTANLEYSGESGGINESMSDIMGFGVEWYAAQHNGSVKWDWKMGEDCWTPANGTDDALRYMDDPTKDGYSVDNYKNYPKQTEVHGSSGIMNNAFFLLSQGGTNRTSGIQVQNGIGPEAALKIYGRALMFYMTPTTTFAQAREACIKAATDLYGATSQQVQTVKDSWHAVGVG